MLPRGRALFPYVALAVIAAAAVWALSFEPLPPADFTFANGTEIESVDPAIVTGQPEGRIIWSIFEGLTRWHPATLEPIPGVAERWELSDDGLQYTFHLRADALWSDGTPVTAHDFVWSYRRFLDPKSSGKYVNLLYYLKGAEEFNSRTLAPGDPVEVELHEKPDGALPYARGQLIPGKLVAFKRLDPETLAVIESEAEPTWGERAYVVDIDGTERMFLPRGETTPDDQYIADLEICRDVLLDFGEVGVSATDDRTLVLTMKNPTAFFLNLTGFYPLSPTNPRCIETFGSPDWTRPENIVSNGPFELQLRQIRERVRLVKSDTYWNRENVRLNTVDALAVESSTTQVNLYMTGQVDWITTVPATIVSELIAQERDDFRPSPELTINFYRINTTRPPLDNPKVRRALALAVNKQEIVETITRAGEVPALSLVPPGIPGYQQPSGPEFNPDEARRLLAEAGYPGGVGFRKIQILYNTEETHQLVAELIQHHWKDHLGIDVELQNMEWNSYLAAQHALEYDVSRSGWIGDYLDPNTFLDLFLSGNPNNQTGWNSAQFDKLLDAAAKETRPAERMQLLHEAETLLLEEMPVIPLYYRVSKNLVRPYVHGFFPNLQDVHPLEAIWVDQTQKQEFLESMGRR